MRANSVSLSVVYFYTVDDPMRIECVYVWECGNSGSGGGGGSKGKMCAIQLDNFHWKCDLMENEARLFWIRFKGNITFVVFPSNWLELICWYFVLHTHATRKTRTSTLSLPFHRLKIARVLLITWPVKMYRDFLICISIWTHSTRNDHYNFRRLFFLLLSVGLYGYSERNKNKWIVYFC